MRWFVTGCGGQLGSSLLEQLGPPEAAAGARHAELDLTDSGALAQAFDGSFGIVPDVVVNAAACTDVDGCERQPELARRVNAHAPGVLARQCRERGIRLVHVSTDYVFDGQARRPYPEDAEPRPLSVYGHSKLEGERAVLAAAPTALVVRSAWLFGRGRNFVAAVCARAAQGGAGLRVVDDQTGSPTWAHDLAAGIIALVEREASGLYHLANAGAATRFELARAALDHVGRADVPIQRIRTGEYPTPAQRPLYSVLECSKAARVGVRLRHWREALAGYLDSDAAPCAAERS